MADDTTVVAESSPAAVETPTLELPRSNTPEYQTWRETGEVPAQAKSATEASTPSDTPKEETEDTADSAAQAQESKGKRKPDVEARFKSLTDELKAMKAELEEARKPKDVKQETSKPANPQNYEDWRKQFKATEWVEKYAKDNPDGSYEEAHAAMADHLYTVRREFEKAESAREAQAKEINGKISEAQSRYENFSEVVAPFVDKFGKDPQVSPVLKQMVNDSDVFADLAFTLAGDDKFMPLAQSDPGKAIRYIAKVESLIQEELSKGKTTEIDRNAKGQFKAEAPVKRGPETAPAPPLEVGSRGASTIDEEERAFQAAEKGDSKAFTRWMEAANKKDLARRNGA